MIQYQQTLSSIILIIFFSLPLILPYKEEEETNIKYHKSYYIVICFFIAIYKWLFYMHFYDFSD